ncbi:CBU_0592 family membrane protein [Aliikangiella sp. IMCC44653]
MEYNWYNFVGNIGVALTIGTYFLLQIEKLRSESLMYSMLNLIGALCITTSLSFDFNLSAFVVEISWIIISLIGVIKYWGKHKKKRITSVPAEPS